MEHSNNKPKLEHETSPMEMFILEGKEGLCFVCMLNTIKSNSHMSKLIQRFG